MHAFSAARDENAARRPWPFKFFAHIWQPASSYRTAQSFCLQVTLTQTAGSAEARRTTVSSRTEAAASPQTGQTDFVN
ncbi:hypothetical protein BaRGS_00006855 [Batillaria attramentaria]|uniref:Uncharacterized protein n=1 Tax=Batillaria attramentaria TaxID=370345 RepID=A0ABD0LRJ9_9CAEN